MNNLDQTFSYDEDEDVIFADEEELVFAPESNSTQSKEVDSWKILLVDDEREIHDVTKLALNDFVFEGKSLTFLSAYSGAEAREIVREHDDIAMILLDVIMETDDAGLEVVKYIRDNLRNNLVRIILRTGQPGKIPEDTIILGYDINDYKTKTELTRKKLFTKVITSLRGFSALVKIEKSKQELADIAIENAKLYEQIEQYAYTLEEKVVQRTKELETKNQQLEQEINERKRIEEELQEVNRQLNKLVNLDGLTGVANRRHFNDYLEQEWKRLKREQNPLSLVLCDVDHFKLFNDSYGHLQGDDCLRQVAQEIEKSVKRPADLAARYGGEEFAIILPNTNLIGAQKLAHQIQTAIRNLNIAHHSSPTCQFVTASIGVASYIPQGECRSSQLIESADRALYLAKQQGRDRVILAS